MYYINWFGLKKVGIPVDKCLFGNSMYIYVLYSMCIGDNNTLQLHECLFMEIKAHSSFVQQRQTELIG